MQKFKLRIKYYLCLIMSGYRTCADSAITWYDLIFTDKYEGREYSFRKEDLECFWLFLSEDFEDYYDGKV